MNSAFKQTVESHAANRFVSRKAGSRHPAFGSRSGVTDRNQVLYDRVLAAMADPEGGDLHPRDLLVRLERRGTPMNMSAIYAALKKLAAEGTIQHVLTVRNGRGVSIYRLPDSGAAPASAAAGRLVCTACRRSVDLKGTNSLSKLVSDICRAHGLPSSVETIEIEALCTSCHRA